MARRVRTAVTMLVLVAILVAAAYVGWRGLTQGFDSDEAAAPAVPSESPEPTPTCSTPPPRTLRTDQVRVSVYNAGAPSGTATAVMAALAGQGFIEGELTDAPDPIDIDGVVIWARNPQAARIRLLREQFGQSRVVDRRRRLGAGVNVLVGDFFSGLAIDAPRSIEVPSRPICPADA